MVEQARGALHHTACAGVVGVEGSQRIQLDPASHLLGELSFVLAQVRLQALAVLAATARPAQARDAQRDGLDPHLAQQRGEQQDRLGVERGILGPQRLGADLPELAIAARLSALVAEEAR